MARPIELNLVANVNDFLRGTERIEDALDDVADSLDDVRIDADKAGDKAVDSFRDMARAAKSAESDIEDVGNKGFRGVGEKSAEFKQEAMQNFSEVTSSFDGSMSSIQDLAQGTFGGLASGIAGPLGIAFGAAAVGIGLIGAAIEGVGDATEADAEKAGEWAQAYIEAGSKILSSAQTVAGANEIITDPEKYKQAEENAKNWGVSVGLAVLAMAGNTEALAEATASLEARGDVAIDNAAKAEKASRDLTEAEIEYLASVATGRTALNEQTASMELGAEQADVYSESLRLLAENTAGATSVVDEFGDTVYSLPDGTTVYIDAETGQATTDITAVENKLYALPDKVVKVTADTTEFQRAVDKLVNTGVTRSVALRLARDPYGQVY